LETAIYAKALPQFFNLLSVPFLSIIEPNRTRDCSVFLFD